MDYIDMTGQTYGMLEVKGRAPNTPGKSGTRWICQCECGNIAIIRRDKLLAGRQDCGCVRQSKLEQIQREREAAKEVKSAGKRGRPRTENPQPKPPRPAKKMDRPRPFSKPRGKKVTKAYGFTTTSKCKHCKKVFERPTGEWGYRIGNDLFCRYSCMRAAEREKELTP